MNALSRSMKWIQAFFTISLLVCSLGPMTAANAFADAPLPEYAIQIGAFKQSGNAMKLADRLDKKGYPAFFREEKMPSGDVWHKVYIGTYSSRKGAQQAARTLRQQQAIPKAFFITAAAGPAPKAADIPKPSAPAASDVEGAAHAAVAEQPAEAASSTETGSATAAGQAIWTPYAYERDSRAYASQPPATAPPPEIAPAQAAPKAEEQELAQVFEERITRPAQPVRLSAPGEEPRNLHLSVPREEAKDWRLSAGYRLWYMDMSSRYTGSSVAAKGYLHGPVIGVSYDKLTVQTSALFTINDLDGDAVGKYTTGAGYTKHERLRRNDYDAVVKYRIDGPGRRFFASPLLGITYTRLSDINAAYTNTDGQQYTLKGHMDIWGPTLGLDIDIPLGNPETTPISLSLSGSGMYLRATGRHPGNWPAQGGAYGTAFEGADFAAWGWGGVADAHLRWTIFDALELLAGGRVQSADLSDTSPIGATMRISNGFIGAYGNLNLVW